MELLLLDQFFTGTTRGGYSVPGLMMTKISNFCPQSHLVRTAAEKHKSLQKRPRLLTCSPSVREDLPPRQMSSSHERTAGPGGLAPHPHICEGSIVPTTGWAHTAFESRATHLFNSASGASTAAADHV